MWRIIFVQYPNIYDQTSCKLQNIRGENCCSPHFYSLKANGADTWQWEEGGGALGFDFIMNISNYICFLTVKKVEAWGQRDGMLQKRRMIAPSYIGCCLVNVDKLKY